ncbi:hypothetical protein ACTQ56_08390 [[Clostridium] aminophilum]|uniref:hypothetical protein n=1 Tax=[Clostridium] aminophilum TaxID=1526 RepID=UPI003F980D69
MKAVPFSPTVKTMGGTEKFYKERIGKLFYSMQDASLILFMDSSSKEEHEKVFP